MAIFRDFNIEIDIKEIVRLMGYKDSIPDSEVLELIESEIERCRTYINPQITWERIGIKSIGDNNICLNNDVILEGEFIAKKLLKCEYVIALATTIGKDVDLMIQDAFNSGDYLKGMIINNIATSALGYVNKVFWNKMVDDIKNINYGITSRLSPGDTQWEVKEQTKIFKCLDGNDIGVELTESNMMIPLKSTSSIYGFGEGIGITRIEHVCSECTLKNCSFRMTPKIEVIINNKGKKEKFMVNKNSLLLDELRKNGIFVESPCGGNGSCGKCRINVISGEYEASEQDKRHLSDRELNKGIRLACSLKVDNDMEIVIEDQIGKMEIMTFGNEALDELETNFTPLVTKKHLLMNKPNIHDQRDDYKRIAEALELSHLIIGYELLPKISKKLKDADFNITASVYKNELLQIEAGDTTDISFGVAVDIGTTTIACYLMDLTSGKILLAESQVNKQRAYGGDVISRINFTIENTEGTKILMESIVNQINDMIEILCTHNNISALNIYNISIVGNTTMIHFLLGLPSQNIAMAPFIPVILSPMDFKAKELGIKINGIVSIMPGIASYVGSDITAGILASGMMNSKQYSILLDIGTNGEIAIGNEEGILTCSTAAGPAFEGANIKCGIGGVSGAISKVALGKENIYSTINKASACGICGSGVLDIVSEFIKYKVIDETGRIQDEDEILNEDVKKRIYEKDNKKEFLLEDNVKKGEPIVFTQRDVREVQLAKAAVAAGIQLVIKEMGITNEDIHKVYIGGGFGNFMDTESALTIGMMPSELKGKIYSIGNCAGTGARLYLLSQKSREKALEIIKKASYIELSTRQDFQDYYIDSMMF
jgi:uncharacterized 2Fe-2S/4Fe-4S cluster protein (DUF4445 family)